MHYIGLAFVGGVLAFAHCLGMCGGFALHLSQGTNRTEVFKRQLLWHAGKTTTYIFLGALAGFVGHQVGALENIPWLQDTLTYLIGAVMILMALSMLGILPTHFKGFSGQSDQGLFSSLLNQLFRQTTPTGALVLGLGTGFLPCPIVVGFLALAMQSGSVPLGMAIMGAMGVGTVWSLLLLGLTGHLVTLRLRKWSPVLAGVILLVLGTATVARGTPAFHQILGCPTQKTISHNETHSCCHEKE